MPEFSYTAASPCRHRDWIEARPLPEMRGEIHGGLDRNDEERRPDRRVAGHCGGAARDDDDMHQHEPAKGFETAHPRARVAKFAADAVVAEEGDEVARRERADRHRGEPAVADSVQQQKDGGKDADTEMDAQVRLLD